MADRRIQYAHMTGLPASILFTSLLFCVLFALCCDNTPEHPGDYDLTDRLQWHALNTVFEKNDVILQSPDGKMPAMIRQRVKRLLQNRVYRLSMRVKALTRPTGNVNVDLFLGEHYDSPEHELVVPMDAVGPSSRSFKRLLNSGTFNELPYIRVFTFSRVPVLIEEVTLVEVH